MRRSQKKWFWRVNLTFIFSSIALFCATRATSKLWSSVKQGIVCDFWMAGLKCSMCTNPKRGQCSSYVLKKIYSLICCVPEEYTKTINEIYNNQWNIMWRNHRNFTKRIWRYNGMNGENVLKDQNVYLFVLNFQWSTSLCLWTKVLNKLFVNWRFESSDGSRKGIVHQKSIPPKTINQSIWKMCQLSNYQRKYEEIIEMIKRMWR
jgi:hypothetical protein